jgi:hypothetical protein
MHLDKWCHAIVEDSNYGKTAGWYYIWMCCLLLCCCMLVHPVINFRNAKKVWNIGWSVWIGIAETYEKLQRKDGLYFGFVLLKLILSSSEWNTWHTWSTACPLPPVLEDVRRNLRSELERMTSSSTPCIPCVLYSSLTSLLKVMLLRKWNTFPLIHRFVVPCDPTSANMSTRCTT